jgi:hypothetical protein
MIERRALERIKINQPAMLHFDGISGVHVCIVRDFNDGGAKFHCPFYIFSSDFDLSLDGFKTTMRCHVVWRRGTTCGVRFKVARDERRMPHSELLHLEAVSRTEGLPQ